MASNSGKLDEALNIVDTYIINNNITGEQKQIILSLKIQVLLKAKQLETASKLIADLIAIDPNSESAKSLSIITPEMLKPLSNQL